MYYRIFLLLVLALVLSPVLWSLDVEERVGPDPILRGVWRAHATSKDLGKTVDTVDEPFDLCLVRAGTIVWVGGNETKIEQAFIIEEEGKSPGNMLVLDNGVRLVCSKEKGSIYVLVQTFVQVDGEYAETFRTLVTVE